MVVFRFTELWLNLQINFQSSFKNLNPYSNLNTTNPYTCQTIKALTLTIDFRLKGMINLYNFYSKALTIFFLNLRINKTAIYIPILISKIQSEIAFQTLKNGDFKTPAIDHGFEGCKIA